MALKRNKSYGGLDDISHFMNVAAERGGVASLTLAASFTSDMDDPDNTVEYAAAVASGTVPVGVLMQDVVDRDPTKEEKNYQNAYEVLLGNKVWVLREGFVETNMIDPAVLVGLTPGDAYLAANGLLSDVPGVAGKKVGRFESYPDADGYVKFYINVNQ